MRIIWVTRHTEGAVPEGCSSSVPSGKTAGDGEPFMYDPPESRQVDEIIDGFLVREKHECSLFGLVHKIQGFPEGERGLHENRFSEVDNEPEPPHLFFFFPDEIFLHTA